MNIFWSMKILWIFFFFGGGGGHHKIWLYLGVISMHFSVFCKGTEWVLKFQIFLLVVFFIYIQGTSV